MLEVRKKKTFPLYAIYKIMREWEFFGQRERCGNFTLSGTCYAEVPPIGIRKAKDRVNLDG